MSEANDNGLSPREVQMALAVLRLSGDFVDQGADAAQIATALTTPAVMLMGREAGREAALAWIESLKAFV